MSAGMSVIPASIIYVTQDVIFSEYLTCSGDEHLSKILELSSLALKSSFLFFLYGMTCITCSQVMTK